MKLVLVTTIIVHFVSYNLTRVISVEHLVYDSTHSPILLRLRLANTGCCDTDGLTGDYTCEDVSSIRGMPSKWMINGCVKYQHVPISWKKWNESIV